MKKKTHFNQLLWMLSFVFITTIYSCSDNDVVDNSNFALFYSGITDIGPSMTFESNAPTYIGATPSNFAVHKVMYKAVGEDKATNLVTESFIINNQTGVLSIQNSAELGVGIYKISVSCKAAGSIHIVENALEINMLPAVPEGVTVEPSVVKIDYADLKTSKASAQVATDGNHVSIIGYAIIQEEEKEYFAINQSGKISINDKYEGDITPGIHNISLKLTTNAGDCIFENAVQFDITSKPLALTYVPAEGVLEKGKTFASEKPIIKGSLENLKYTISTITPPTSAITIDETTGVISVVEKNNLEVGNRFVIDVVATNVYGKTTFPSAYQLEVVDYIAPIENFSYPAVDDAMQAVNFSTTPSDEMKGDAVTYSLVNNLEGQLTINELTGEISAKKGNTIPLGIHQVEVKAENIKNSAVATLVVTVKENPYYFTYVRYGNNLSLSPIENYANQFRFKSEDGLKNFSVSPQTDVKEGVDVIWEVNAKRFMAGTEIDTNGTLTFCHPDEEGNPQTGWKAANSGLVYVKATTGKGTPAEVSITVPVFFNFASEVNGVRVLYTPFVFQINPRTGGSSVKPVIEGVSDLSQFMMDYRRSFMFYNFDGPSSHIDGQPKQKDSFMYQVWKGYYQTIGSATINTGSKDPMSFSANDNVKGRTLPMALGYVDWTNEFALKINPNKYVDENGVPANGAMTGQMVFVDDGNLANLNKSKKQIYPIFIWFDEKF